MDAAQTSSSVPDSDRIKRRSGAALIRALLAFLLTYTTWAWAGLRPSFHGVGVAASVIMLAVVFLAGRSAVGRVTLRDPVFYLGLAFLGFLALQWANAGRAFYFDVGYQRWMYMPPKWPGWPSAFSGAEARQMLTWFFPAWGIAVTIRSQMLDRRDLRGLLTFMCGSSGLLALFGVVQFSTGSEAIYWLHPLDGRFFASFAYGNHAASYFLLAGALAAGLLHEELFDSSWVEFDGTAPFQVQRPGRVAGLALILLLCLAGANLGLSRTGVLLAFVLALGIVACFWVSGWRMLAPVGRLNLAAVTLAIAGSLYFVVAGVGAKAIQEEMALKAAPSGGTWTAWSRINLELGERPQLAQAAMAIWRKHPWVGVGGWGFKYLLAEQIPANLWRNLKNKGWANVHCDFLQFLTEYGVVGMALLLGTVGAMARDLWRRPFRPTGLWLLSVFGLGLVLVASVVDLPFRCPAILYAWVAVLAALPFACRLACSVPPPTTIGSSPRWTRASSPDGDVFPERN